MILVKRSRPALLPASSAPTIVLTGSLVGPVMMRPRESVLTAVSKKRSSKGASGGVSRIFRWKASEKVWFERVALARRAPDINHNAHAATAAHVKRTCSLLPMFVAPLKRLARGRRSGRGLLRLVSKQSGARAWKYIGRKKRGWRLEVRG